VIVLSKAKRLQAQLRVLRYERGIALDDPPTLPLLPAAAPPMILSGVASRALTLDADHIRTAPRAFGPLPLPHTVPLRLDHDEKSSAGTIEDLTYDADGSLLIVARVTCAKAVNGPAFSVAAIIDEFEVDERDATGTVTKARLMEISLVAQPVDPHALVLSRSRPQPVTEFYSLMASRVDCLQRMAALVKEMNYGTA
jgi:hypothetical protein